MGYSSWGCKELDTTEGLTFSLLLFILYDLVEKQARGFPSGSVVKESPGDSRDSGSMPGS